MHEVSLTLTNSWIIGTMSLDPSRITGEGAPTYPCLVFPFQFSIYPSKSKGAMIAITHLSASLHAGVPASDQNQLGPGSQMNLYGFTTRSMSSPTPNQGTIQVRLPVSQALLTHIEDQRLRHLEHAALLHLHLQPTIAWMERSGNLSPDGYEEHPFKDVSSGPFSSLAPFWYPQAGDLSFQVSASDWAQHVLPGLGYNTVRFLEIALPSSLDFLPDTILAYYDTAQRHFDQGNYREAMASCRDIRNTIEEHLGAIRTSPVATVFADRLGLPPDAPQRALLDATWKALATATNQAHHLPEGPRLTGADARMCLFLTAMLLDYLIHLR